MVDSHDGDLTFFLNLPNLHLSGQAYTFPKTLMNFTGHGFCNHSACAISNMTSVSKFIFHEFDRKSHHGNLPSLMCKYHKHNANQ